MAYDYTLSTLLRNHIARKSRILEVDVFGCDLAHDCTIRIISNTGTPRVSIIHLPCKIPVKTMLPDTKMLVFMQLQEHPTKQAKPADWIAIIDEALEKNFPEHLAVQK